MQRHFVFYDGVGRWLEVQRSLHPSERQFLTMPFQMLDASYLK